MNRNQHHHRFTVPTTRAFKALGLSASLAVSVLSYPSYSADWPGYRGIATIGQTEESVSATWPTKGPPQLWKTDTPDGFSSFAAANGRVYTMIRRSVKEVDREVCVALAASSGKELWATPVGVAKYDGGGNSGAKGNTGGDGPRSTPAIDGDRVYTFNAQLVLSCLDAASGELRWTRDLVREHDGQAIKWQNAASPVVAGSCVLVAGGGPGQSLLGIDKLTGKVRWKTGDESITHATPTVATLLGVRQAIFLTQSGLVGVDATTGNRLWAHRFKFKTSTAASPVVAGSIVYCSAGYGVGALAVRVSRTGSAFQTTELWRSSGSRGLANHWSTPVHHRGYLYGLFSFKEYGRGPLKCVQVSTGEVLWEQEGFGAGNVIVADDTLVALTDSGEVVLVAADPKAYRELARAQVLSGKCWSTPALAEGRLYVRSTLEGACLDLTPAEASK